MHEDLDITNHGPKPVRFNLEIAIRSDFADVFEVKSGRIVRRGRITPTGRTRIRRCAPPTATATFPARGAISARATSDSRAVLSPTAG